MWAVASHTNRAVKVHEFLRVRNPHTPCSLPLDKGAKGILFTMGTASVTLDAIRERLAHHRETLRREFRVARLAVFGSYARGTARKRSDVDILVDFEPSGIIFDNYMELKFYLQRVLGRRVDLVMIDALRPELRSKILLEAIDV
jgi:predicted nucleotidyltransferase